MEEKDRLHQACAKMTERESERDLGFMPLAAASSPHLVDTAPALQLQGGKEKKRMCRVCECVECVSVSEL